MQLFNRLENSPDPVHLAFVHRWSPFTDSGLIGIPQPSGEETDYGIEVRARRPNEKVRVTHFHMPNVNLISDSGGAGESGGEAGVSINLSWRVPVDDEHCISFNANHVPLKSGAAELIGAHRRDGDTPSRSASELAEAVLRGELRIEDATNVANIVNVQDYVAQIGQGAIAPRAHDHLGHSDVLVILLRRLWERELRALAEGRPLKQWRRRGPLATVYGV
jgi:5,5'-dehydrodivanillate O-demethylase